jgi:hypothetical protein
MGGSTLGREIIKGGLVVIGATSKAVGAESGGALY